MAAFCVSCGNDGYDFEDGSVKFAVSADYSTSAVKSEAGEGNSLNVDDFTLELFNSSGKRFKRWTYGEIKDKNVPLNIGTFTAKAFYGDSLATGFDAPFFYGTHNFKVDRQSHTSVAVTCKMANVKVAVEWGEKIRTYADYYVEVSREGKKGSLMFTKNETRYGYIPKGDLKLDITLVDDQGNKRVYTPKVVTCAANDFITFTIDSKESLTGDLSVSFRLVTDTEDKNESVVIPATLVAKEAPTLDPVGFTENSVSFMEGAGIAGDLYIGVTAPGYAEKLELVSQSSFMPEGWPEVVDLLSCDGQTLALLESYGLSWDLEKGLNRYGTLNLAGLAKKLASSGDSTYDFAVKVTDVKGKTAETAVSFAVSEALVQMKAVPDYDMWSKKVFVEVETNAPSADLFSFEAVDGNSVGTKLDAEFVGKSGDVYRYMVKGLTPSTQYSIRANYSNGLKYTEGASVSTESAKALENGSLDAWSETTIYSGNGTFSTAIYCDFVTGWCTRNEVSTYGAKDASMGFLGLNGDYGLYYRWHSGTNPITGRNGNAAEISTMAFWTKKSGTLNVSNRSDIFSWVQSNGKVYTGYLFLGTMDKANDKYTLGIAHDARPESLTFWYRYSPVSGDNCSAYAIVYDSGKNEIARTETFTSTGASDYTQKTLDFTYSNKTAKASYITVFFKSGESVDISKMRQVEGDYTVTPFPKDKIVGSILVIDDVSLNY